MSLGFIRYFATTNDTPVGKAALAYLSSLLRIAPVRVVSKSGQLEGQWRRFEQLIMTPMAGTCVSCVCTPPSQWIWEASVPMPAKNLGAQGAAVADAAPAIGGTAKGTQELYTVPSKTVLRNVLFVVQPPQTDAQRKTAARYEAVVISDGLLAGYVTSYRNAPTNSGYPKHISVPVIDHDRIRECVLGTTSELAKP